MLAVFLLAGCAAEAPLKPRPGVMEAKACMQKVNKPLSNNPEYIVLNCTNNGLWTVERIEPATGTAVERIDFVNQEYWGIETDGQLVPFTDLGFERIQYFSILRKDLNADLLSQKTKKQEITTGFLQKLNPF